LPGGSLGGSSLPTQSGPGVAPTVSVRHPRHFSADLLLGSGVQRLRHSCPALVLSSLT
jgi:hypothetical protein